jgi:hypothetical protein
MPRHPLDGIKHSKPRISSAGNGRFGKAELSALNREYLTCRNQQMAAKAEITQMAAAERRGELLNRTRLKQQIADVLVAFRAAVLNFPARYASRMVGLPDEHAARQVATEAAHEFLVQLSELRPEKIFQHEDRDEGEKPLRPASGQQIAAEEERIKRRRVKKAATMRKLRAKG